MTNRTKIAAVVGGGVLAVGAALGVGLAVTSHGSKPQPVQVFTPAGATLSTSTTSTVAQTTTTTAPAPSTTVATTTTTTPPPPSTPVYGLVGPATTTTTAAASSSTTSTTLRLVTVPDVNGMTISQATPVLEAAGLRPGWVTGDSSAGGSAATGCYVAGAVITSTAPPAGAKVGWNLPVGFNC